MLNLHHLELFYFVCRYGGISRACQRMPYGVQQPAVSTQLKALEQEIGESLFERRPFRLLPPGEYLFGEIAPFFNRLGDLPACLKGKPSQELRVAAPAEFLRLHMPTLARQLHHSFPHMKLRVFQANQKKAIDLMDEGEAKIAATAIESPLGKEYNQRSLIDLQLALVTKKGRRGVGKLCADISMGVIPNEPLIAPPPREVVTRMFHQHLRRMGKVWDVTIEASSGDLVANYVAEGLGVGLWVYTPGIQPGDTVRVHPLGSLEPIHLAAYWRGNLSPIEESFLSALENRTAGIMRKRT